jgi:hypothetical protein
MKWISLLVACFLMLAVTLLLGCGPAQTTTQRESVPTGPPWFEDVTEKCCLSFTHDAGPTGSYFLPQITGSGAALFDFDQDGLLDIYLLQNGGPGSGAKNQLFHQTKDGRFENVSVGSGLDIDGHNMGVAIGDVNNDGWPDVLVTQYGGIKLFLNNGNGTFTDITASAGLENPYWGMSAAFVDYDRDGWLDLVVTNYVNYDPSHACIAVDGLQDYCHPSRFDGTATRLFHNRGRVDAANPNAVKFTDVTVPSGLGQVPGPGMGVVCADFNGDGWPDFFVANDGKPNRLWINQKNGTFKDEAVARNVAFNNMGQTRANMGVALGDVYGDGHLGLFVTHVSMEQHTFYRADAHGIFQDATASAGLAGLDARGTGWGTAFVDFDQDGALDLVIANGAVYRRPPPTNPALGPYWTNYGERSQLFAGDGKGRFRPLVAQAGAFGASESVSRGLAVGDLNGDGAIDLLVTNVNGPARLYRNVAPNRGHWLIVRALDPALKRDAYGALITLEAGGRSRVGLLHPTQSYLCSNAPYVHFGLGSVEKFESLRVLWPDGSVEVFPGQKVNQTVVLKKGEGKAVAP